MKKLWLCIMVLFLSGPGLFADDGTVDGTAAGTAFERWPSALGFYANSEAGSGLSWQRWFGDFGLSLAVGGFYNEDAGTDRSGYYESVLDYNVQARFSWIVHALDYRLWLSTNLQAVAYVAHRGITALEYDRYDEVTYESYYTRLPFRTEWMLGAGVAAEMTLFGHLSQTVDFMYVAKVPLELTPAAGWGLRYRY